MSERRGNSGAGTGELAEKLSAGGLRLTAQRERIYHVLLAQTDHPTADEVYLRAKAEKPDISLATVYNTLDALVKCGLVKQVNVARVATRYCSNRAAHCHFYCEECGGVHDVELSGSFGDFPVRLPRDLAARQMDLSIRGACRNPEICRRRAADSKNCAGAPAS